MAISKSFTRYISHERTAANQLQYVDTPSFLIDQILMNLPCVFVWMAGFWFAAFTKQGRPYRFAAWAYVFVIILLIVLHGKNYYSIGVYPMLFAFGSFHLEQFTLAEKIFTICFCAHHFYSRSSADSCCIAGCFAGKT